MTTYTHAQVARMRRLGSCTAHDVVYVMDGKRFSLVREPHHFDEDIDAAKKWLRSLFSVDGQIAIATIKDEPVYVAVVTLVADLTREQLEIESKYLTAAFWDYMHADTTLPAGLVERLAAVNMEAVRRIVPTHTKFKGAA